ncbi:MAG: hypothetical protein H0V17_23185 [Deltaproteobacteria bacterium]|nr:hypothetical protein [Deltaproteobacteria bacterium]
MIGGIGMVREYGALPSITPLVALLALIVLPLVALHQATRGTDVGLVRCGTVLVPIGGLIMMAALRPHLVAHLDRVSWNRAVPIALLAIVVGIVALGLGLAARHPRIRGEVVAAAWFLGLWAPWFLWRWWYYGHPFPNTYYVKAAGAWSNPDFASQMRDHGLYYVWAWLVQTRLLFALPLVLIGLVAIRPRTPRFVLAASAALLLVVYLAYTVTVGGDFMGLHRFIMPLFVMAAIAVTLGLEWLTRLLPEEQVVFPGSLTSLAAMLLAIAATITYALVVGDDFIAATGRFVREVGELFADRASSISRPLADPRLWLPIVVVIGAIVTLWRGRGSRVGLSITTSLLLVGAFASSQAGLTARSLDPKNLAADRGVIDTPAFLIVYTEDRAKIGQAMAPCFRDDDYSIVGGAGAQPYFGRMQSIDVFGLVSDKIAHRAPRSRPRAGHTKWGSEPLLAEYDPDFVFSCYRIHRTPAQPQLPCASFWLRRGFEHVTVKVAGMKEQGEYYTFLASKDRAFECPIRVR